MDAYSVSRSLYWNQLPIAGKDKAATTREHTVEQQNPVGHSTMKCQYNVWAVGLVVESLGCSKHRLMFEYGA